MRKGLFRQSFFYILRFHNSFLYISNFTDIFIAVQKIISWKAGKSELICLHGSLRLYRLAGVAAPFNLERVNNCFFGKQPTVAGLERIGGLIMEKR